MQTLFCSSSVGAAPCVASTSAGSRQHGAIPLSGMKPKGFSLAMIWTGRAMFMRNQALVTGF